MAPIAHMHSRIEHQVPHGATLLAATMYLQDSSWWRQWAGLLRSGTCQVMLPRRRSPTGSSLKAYVKFMVTRGPLALASLPSSALAVLRLRSARMQRYSGSSSLDAKYCTTYQWPSICGQSNAVRMRVGAAPEPWVGGSRRDSRRGGAGGGWP